ncbi:cyclase family protein [Streptomyces sp. SudanB182_2057]|uniref:cyclase family protein n=1 Tax=Streptomyces sp. SudanB182_2057 TaxID=3035281 RepID=UPI003F55E0F4
MPLIDISSPVDASPTLTTRIGAPTHDGARGAYGRPKTIDQDPLEWFYHPGVVLDLTAAGVGSVDAGFIAGELKRVGYELRPYDIAPLRTGAEKWSGPQCHFTDFTGLDGSAVHHLLDRGVRITGTDTFSLDAPFAHIRKRYAETRDRSLLWPAFTVVCSPVCVAGAEAGTARAVAVLD